MPVPNGARVWSMSPPHLRGRSSGAFFRVTHDRLTVVPGQENPWHGPLLMRSSGLQSGAFVVFSAVGVRRSRSPGSSQVTSVVCYIQLPTYSLVISLGCGSKPDDQVHGQPIRVFGQNCGKTRLDSQPDIEYVRTCDPNRFGAPTPNIFTFGRWWGSSGCQSLPSQHLGQDLLGFLEVSLADAPRWPTRI